MVGVLAQEFLIARADIYIAVRFVAEVRTPEQVPSPWLLTVRMTGNVRHHACRFAVSDQVSIGVTGVGDYLELSTSSALFAASAIGFKQRISDASSTTACATINACFASTAVRTLYAGRAVCRTNINLASGSGCCFSFSLAQPARQTDRGLPVVLRRFYRCCQDTAKRISSAPTAVTASRCIRRNSVMLL